MAEPIEIKVVGTDDSAKALASAEAGVKDLGAAAEQTAPKLKKTGDGMSGLGDRARRSSKDTEEYASRLDRAGEAGGNAESQFLGLGAGISGTTALMKGGSLSAEEMAMAVADIGDSIEHTVVPWLGKAKDAVGGFVERLGGVKTVAAGAAGAAGLGAVIFAANELAKAKHAQGMEDMAEGLLSINYAATESSKEAIRAAESMGYLDDQFAAAEQSGTGTARKLIELMEAAGVSESKIAEFRAELEESTRAQENARAATEAESESLETLAERITRVNDERRAAADPIFAVIDALNQNRDAQRSVIDSQVALDEAIKEHGRNSIEAADAQRDLNDAQIEAVQSASDAESAASELEAQIAEHPATLANAKLALQRWVAQGLITEEQARQMGVRFQDAANKANRIQGTSTRTLNARDNASHKIISVGNRLEDLDGRTATVSIGARVGSAVGAIIADLYGNAAGGPTVGHAAVGGPRGATWMHEQGPEVAFLPNGSMVVPAGKSREIMAGMASGGGGGAPVFVLGNPSDSLGRAIMDWLRDSIRDGYGGDAQRALGY